MTTTPLPQNPLDPRCFRDVLGNLPTGVTAVTAIDSEGAPAGMAIGSFVSVSLDPPLVAFYVGRGSRSFARIRTASSFCVNVLSSDQQEVCRALSRPDDEKFAGIQWDAAPSGAPRLAGSTAWVDCEFEQVTDAGDHLHVLGRVHSLDATPTLPLVFYQGGYGKFAPSSLVAIPEPDVISNLLHAELARAELEALADATATDCIATAAVGDQLIIVAAARKSPSATVRTRVGQRSPFVAPLGALYALARDADVETWAGPAALRLSAAERLAFAAKLDRVRKRNWSLTLASAAQRELETEYLAYSATDRSPAHIERIHELAHAASGDYEPADNALEGPRPVRMISVPVMDTDGELILLLSTVHNETRMHRGAVLDHVQRLQSSAERIAALVHANRIGAGSS
jgi:flavin reductase (DIM6/NTAB) family NADH-FMN oxidoreductase RutF/DNA-binding IclR family transcriptional regulator